MPFFLAGIPGFAAAYSVTFGKLEIDWSADGHAENGSILSRRPERFLDRPEGAAASLPVVVVRMAALKSPSFDQKKGRFMGALFLIADALLVVVRGNAVNTIFTLDCHRLGR